MTEEETIDIKTIEEWQKILDDSSRYQIEDNETFLDLCHYTGERFEEICSRVLAFFLNPNGKHGFRTLWFNALCKTLQLDNVMDISEMKIQTEEYTYNADNKERGRIDLVLKSPTSVIAIENKINAKLYNKLDKYKTHINTSYHYITENNRYFFVLTAHNLSNDDNNNAKTEKFIVIKYDDLFKNVESTLGEYASKGDQKYLYFMLDFIQTVKNRANMTITELDKFFAKNREEIDKFLLKHETWEKKNLISELKKNLNDETKGKWQSYNGWNLFVNFEHGINIASNFESDSNENPYERFRIYITTGKMECWKKYKDIVEKKYPNKIKLDEGEENTDNRIYFHLKPIELKDYNDNFSIYKEEITNKLKECYDFLKEITDNIDK